jgi:TolA-binding protein
MSFLMKVLCIGIFPCCVNANLSQDTAEMRAEIKKLKKRIDVLEKRVGTSALQTPVDREVFPQETFDRKIKSNVPQEEVSSLGWTQGELPKKQEEQDFSKAIDILPSPEVKGKSEHSIEKRGLENFSQKFINAKKFLSQGQVQKSRTLFKEIKSQDSDYPHALYWLGMISLLQDGNPVQAATYFSKGYQHCESMPHYRLLSVSLLLKLAHSLYLQKKFSAAKIVLGQCQDRAQQVNLTPETQQEISGLEKNMISQ